MKRAMLFAVACSLVGAIAFGAPIWPVAHNGPDETATTTVTNLDTPVGGEDEESDDDIKRHAPRMTRTCRRCGPGNDWQTAFESYTKTIKLNTAGRGLGPDAS